MVAEDAGAEVIAGAEVTAEAAAEVATIPVLEATEAEETATEEVAEEAGTVLFEPPLTSTASTFLAAASAATITIACVFPVGKSGWKDASTTNRLSVP